MQAAQGMAWLLHSCTGMLAALGTVAQLHLGGTGHGMGLAQLHSWTQAWVAAWGTELHLLGPPPPPGDTSGGLAHVHPETGPALSIGG